MRDLRLVGVHEDGAHLLLSDDVGERFRLPLDEALRAAAQRDRPRLGQLQIRIEGGARPREVQAMIRSGLSAAEVADRAGWPVEKVHKYEGPVLAEREYVAGLGRSTPMRSRGGHAAVTQTLEQRVLERLATRAVEPDAVAWDSWRREGTEWTVAVTFAAGGRQRQAHWYFDVPTHTLLAQDDEARWLSEEEPTDLDERSETPPYDVEADGGLHPPTRPRGTTRAEVAAHTKNPTDRVDLVVSLRERSSARSRRRSSRRRAEPVTLPLDSAEGNADPPESVNELVERPAPATPDADPTHADPTHADPTHAEAPTSEHVPAEAEDGANGVDVADPEPPPATDRGHGSRATGLAALFRAGDLGTGDSDTSGAGEEPSATPRKRGSGRRRGSRTPVPSWDDIVLGTRTRDDGPAESDHDEQAEAPDRISAQES
ncbi:MAG: hypothetical protein CSA84_06215 [Actinomycetales bacterium]|nr:MAG: hypothetical protein CSA84_06215 [Actinomycetales bacterium]